MQKLANFLGNVCKFCKKFDDILLKFCEWSGAKEYQSDRSRQELSNEYLIAKIGFDTAENEPSKFARPFAVQPATASVILADLAEDADEHVEDGEARDQDVEEENEPALVS